MIKQRYHTVFYVHIPKKLSDFLTFHRTNVTIIWAAVIEPIAFLYNLTYLNASVPFLFLTLQG